MAHPKSVWGQAPIVNNNEGARDFRSILQEEESRAKKGAESDMQFAETKQEEQLILLAMERSKAEMQSAPGALNYTDDFDGEDADFKRALAASLGEADIGGNEMQDERKDDNNSKSRIPFHSPMDTTAVSRQGICSPPSPDVPRDLRPCLDANSLSPPTSVPLPTQPLTPLTPIAARPPLDAATADLRVVDRAGGSKVATEVVHESNSSSQQYSENDPKQELTPQDPATEASALSIEDQECIAKAIREADEEENRRSMELAMKLLQQERQEQHALMRHRYESSGNVRVRSRAEIQAETLPVTDSSITRYPIDIDYTLTEGFESPGFRMNSAREQEWARMDRHSVVGPNNEVRTKHDIELNGKSNAHRIGLDSQFDDDVILGNQAYNSFMSSVKKSKKGVVTQGTGRAGSDADTTKRGMDPTVRLHITRAINGGVIERLNGIVKEGKEAVLHHADKVPSNDFDVAVKIFKKIQEFRSRGDYVQGDPRYSRESFRKASARDQLALWAEKEYRNIIRANRAGVPVPSPIMVKDNILFMRFIGEDCWPAPQLRELDLRRGSKRWSTLYKQVLVALKRLYHQGRLVHGDLSEYNILVAPAWNVENKASGITEANSDDLQVVLIDFGQAVDTLHPSAAELLERDLKRISTFFQTVGVEVMSHEDALGFIYVTRTEESSSLPFE